MVKRQARTPESTWEETERLWYERQGGRPPNPLVMSAAPDLLKALSGWVRLLEAGRLSIDGPHECADITSATRAAIAKAEGLE